MDISMSLSFRTKSVLFTLLFVKYYIKSLKIMFISWLRVENNFILYCFYSRTKNYIITSKVILSLLIPYIFECENIAYAH